MKKTVVINAVGLTASLLGPATPRLLKFSQAGKLATITPVLPAVTCSVQATYLTGVLPREHGIVGNGWYYRDECEIKFWRQSNNLVQHPKIWEMARKEDPSFTCANLFWWFAMYSNADYTVTPRPMYPSDGRKLPDIWTHPAELRGRLQGALGQFPLFNFWGPATSIAATQWIADAALKVDQKYNPTLTLIYLPHLDYSLQKIGPDDGAIVKDLGELDGVCGQLLDHYEKSGANIVILSEYGITPVRRPVHLNRVLRQNGLLAIREELGRELLDAGASDAFAVADHQMAHIYVNKRSCLSQVRSIIEAQDGVACVFDDAGKKQHGMDHPRSGELIAMADNDAWFTYYYWLDESRQPDFASTVDIHRKCGYDPAELFFDPKIRWPKAKIAATLLKRKLGMRALMQVIGTDATLVRGSHGLAPTQPSQGAMLMSNRGDLIPAGPVRATDVCELLLGHLRK